MWARSLYIECGPLTCGSLFISTLSLGCLFSIIFPSSNSLSLPLHDYVGCVHVRTSNENEQGVSKIPCLQQCLQPTSTWFLLIYQWEFLCELVKQVLVLRKLQRLQRKELGKKG